MLDLILSQGEDRMTTTYLADSVLITAAGDSTISNFYAYKAGINTYQAANYHTQDHRQITLSLIPNDALPPLKDEIEELALSYRDERLLKIISKAADALLSDYQGTPLPLILAGPENHPDLNNQLPLNFISLLQTQIELPINYSASRTLSTGRTGVIEAIKLAQCYLASGEYEQILVGGVDSCQHSDWLQLLEKDGRIKSQSINGNNNSFVPGEGGILLLFTSNSDQAQQKMGCKVKISSPGFGQESGHIYSQLPYLGQGLDQAVKAALAEVPIVPKIDCVFSSMNGENYWVKEFGVAMTRSEHRFENLKHEHPADCFGDLGAATSGALIALASIMYRDTSKTNACLIYASSDSSHRAALVLQIEWPAEKSATPEKRIL